MTKMRKLFLLIPLFILSTTISILTSDKYIRFKISYPFQIWESATNNHIDILRNENDSIGIKVFRITSKLSNSEKYLEIPQRYLKFIKHDTLYLLDRATIWFNSDSVPKNNIKVPKVFDCDSNQIFPNNILFVYDGEKKIKAIFKNDTADVIINWKMIELEINPLWYGDY